MQLKKTGLVLVALALMAFTTIAIEVGDTITQEQFNNIDFGNADLNFDIVGKGIFNHRFWVVVDYTTLKKLDNGNWELVRYRKGFPYYLGHYVQCRTRGIETELGYSGQLPKSKCISIMKQQLISNIKEFRQYERNRLTKQQTTEYEITINNLDITNQEIQ